MGHLVYLLKRQEGQHTDALEHVAVTDIAPVLIELIGAGLVRVEPHGVAGGLAHLVPLRVGKQGDGHGVGVLAELAAYEFRAAEHVAPLVVAAELHIAVIVLEQVVEVVALHYHVVELKEAESLLHALLVALGAEHVIDGEACADLTQEVYIVEVQQPVGVVYHDGLVLAELNKALHLALEALCIMLNVLAGEHFAHVCAAGGVAYHGGAAADKRDRLVAGHL